MEIMKLEMNYKLTMGIPEEYIENVKNNMNQENLKRILNELNYEFLDSDNTPFDSEFEVKFGDEKLKVSDDNYPF